MAGLFGGGGTGSGGGGSESEKSTPEERKKLGMTWPRMQRQDALMASRYPQLFKPGGNYRSWAVNPKTNEVMGPNWDPSWMTKRKSGAGGSGTVLGG